jgi:hypothetical protein
MSYKNYLIISWLCWNYLLSSVFVIAKGKIIMSPDFDDPFTRDILITITLDSGACKSSSDMTSKNYLYLTSASNNL